MNSICARGAWSAWWSIRDREVFAGTDGTTLSTAQDASTDEALHAAGIERASGLVAATGDDATNLFITLTARSLNEKLVVVARANQPTSEAKFMRAGASHIISPYTISGRRIATQLLYPYVTDFLDVVMHTDQLELWLETAAGIGTVGRIKSKRALYDGEKEHRRTDQLTTRPDGPTPPSPSGSDSPS